MPQQYRVFVEDVGPDRFSGLADAEAPGPRTAIVMVTDVDEREDDLLLLDGLKLIALPHSRKDLWPDGSTGIVPDEAFRFC